MQGGYFQLESILSSNLYDEALKSRSKLADDLSQVFIDLASVNHHFKVIVILVIGLFDPYSIPPLE